MAIDDFPDRDLVKRLIARDRLGLPRDLGTGTLFCTGCHRITDLRECWGCRKWFCYDCLIEHMMGCPEWQKIKGNYETLFECDKYEICEDCPYRFKCYTGKKIPKRKVSDANL